MSNIEIVDGVYRFCRAQPMCKGNELRLYVSRGKLTWIKPNDAESVVVGDLTVDADGDVHWRVLTPARQMRAGLARTVGEAIDKVESARSEESA